MSSVAEQKSNKPFFMTFFCNGHLISGSPYYAYVEVPVKKVPDFIKAREKGNFELEEFGTVIVAGKTLEPPEYVKLKMQELFLDNWDDEDAFFDEFEKELATFKKQHKHRLKAGIEALKKKKKPQ